MKHTNPPDPLPSIPVTAPTSEPASLVAQIPSALPRCDYPTISSTELEETCLQPEPSKTSIESNDDGISSMSSHNSADSVSSIGHVNPQPDQPQVHETDQQNPVESLHCNPEPIQLTGNEVQHSDELESASSLEAEDNQPPSDFTDDTSSLELVSRAQSSTEMADLGSTTHHGQEAEQAPDEIESEVPQAQNLIPLEDGLYFIGPVEATDDEYPPGTAEWVVPQARRPMYQA